MKDNKGSVYMCMSCGNCKRKDENNGLFSFACTCGEFPVDATFAARIEFIGCRSWLPADDNYNEPFFIKIDEKHKTVEIGKWGKEFKTLTQGEMSDIYDAYSNEADDGEGMSAMILKCQEAYGE